MWNIYIYIVDIMSKCGVSLCISWANVEYQWIFWANMVITTLKKYLCVKRFVVYIMVVLVNRGQAGVHRAGMGVGRGRW